MYTNVNLQAEHLKRFVDNKEWILIYLKNGTKLRGQLIGFSGKALFLKSCDKEIIYRNAINTVLPSIFYQVGRNHLYHSAK